MAAKMLHKISGNYQPRELGFGKYLTTSGRLMNANGSFNVRRQQVGIGDNVYYHLIMMPTWQFFSIAFLLFGLTNMIFALLYLLVGIEQLNGLSTDGTWIDDFLGAYFFSSQTLTTVGYGHISPSGLAASALASIESFLGLLTFALISGLLYGRFSRPTARIVFSENLLVAPYREGQALMFRMANVRRSELLETEVQMIVTLNQRDEKEDVVRRFFALDLELSKVTFFSMSWTIVHALNDKSPLFGFTEQDLLDSAAEFLIMVKGNDEANEQTVHARKSYIAEEIVWNARFKPVMGMGNDGRPVVLTSMIGDYEALA